MAEWIQAWWAEGLSSFFGEQTDPTFFFIARVLFHPGKGTYTWTNGDSYIGEWRQDKKHGKGVFHLANGKRREGTWENDLKHVSLLAQLLGLPGY